MAELKDILFGVSLISLDGDRNVAIEGIAFDSRKVKKGYLFVAIKGLTVDGHDFISQAIEKGAVAIVCEQMPDETPAGITFVKASNTAQSLGILAANFYDHPSKKLKLVGVTGTNGKTTTVTLLYELFSSMGYKSGLLSTVENKISGETLTSQYTTPDAIQLNELLVQMVEAGCSHAFMEVSSHALVQHRVSGIHFAGGVFTNISHDHLDYHKSFDEYIAAKKMLFDDLSEEAFSLVNADDKRGRVMVQNSRSTKLTFSLKSMADYRAKVLHNTLQGLELEIDGVNVWFKLIGDFNAYNILGVYATAVLLGEEQQEVLKHLSTLKAARGRFEYVPNELNVLAIVDYAHTPDALENVLSTIDDLRTKNEQLITVVGCGGDRDKDKRPKMAALAFQYSNKVILTSDNPRTEDPEAILDDMAKGIPVTGQRNVIRITSRKEAIRTACSMSREQDIILVAGKGHETYQEINGVRHHFDDKAILDEILNPKHKS